MTLRSARALRGAATSRTPRLEILYVGTLPPHHGGSAVMAGQILEELGRRGHRVTAIAPITEEAHEREQAGNTRSVISERRFVMPFLETSPDSPQSSEYHWRERDLVAQMLEEVLADGVPDLMIVGRESFASHVSAIHGVPRILFVQGATTAGIANGRYPSELAEPLLAAMRSYDRVVTFAAPTQRTMESLGVPAVHVIPNPVDLKRFHPGLRSRAVRAALNLTDDDVVVTHASNLKTLKRPLDIVMAAELAVKQDSRLRFVVAGDGHHLDAMGAACEERGLTHLFRFPGWLDHAGMPELLCSSEMVVMPSESECQALVYLETQACARMLIASDIPAAREVVDDGVNGLLFPSGDVEAMARTILRCANDRALCDAIGSRARADVQAHSLPLIADLHEQLLAQLASAASIRA